MTSKQAQPKQPPPLRGDRPPPPLKAPAAPAGWSPWWRGTPPDAMDTSGEGAVAGGNAQEPPESISNSDAPNPGGAAS
eukprot:1831926-Karenia_brevis.AAC.1